MEPGRQLLHYQVVGPLGAGGMGEVYRAQDQRLGREVAIKVLPATFRETPDRLARLEREARMLASVNHPHIATLHGLEQGEDGTRFLVMELVEGETLAARLERGALPHEEVLRLGAQIARALAAAHERGIVHRDLKPGNVMLTRTGVKLLDFGLAKVARSSVHDAPTVTGGALTREGAVVGTYRYMAPEQADGREADERCDLWALGAVLHEMATGRPVSVGATGPSLRPPAFEHLVRSCLADDPDVRRRSSADVALDLEWLAQGGAAPEPATGRRWPWLVAGAATALVAAAGAWLAGVRHEGDRVAGIRTPLHFEIVVPSLEWSVDENALAVSPGGDAIAYVGAAARGGRAGLWVRGLDELVPRWVDGSEGATNPFWSPDGRSVGYVHDDGIKLVDRAGGPSRVVVRDVATYGPPSLGADGRILFAPTPIGGILSVAVEGGEPIPLTSPQGGDELGHWFPHWLPGGRRFLYLAVSRNAERPAQLYVGSFGGEPPREVPGVHSRAEFAAGRLYYWEQGTIVSRAFDPDRGVFEGELSVVGGTFGTHYARTGFAAFGVARHGGAVAYARAERRIEARWFDVTGRDLGRLAEPAGYDQPRISPDGQRVAASIRDRAGTHDVWIFDPDRGVSTRIVGGPGDEGNPAWSPDGARLAYTSDTASWPRPHVRLATGAGDASVVGSAEPILASYVSDWSPDGTALLFRGFGERRKSEGRWHGDSDIYLAYFAENKPSRLYADGPGEQMEARFSRDGRWVAFTSTEVGQPEVFVAPLADGSARQRVSPDGGSAPTWSRAGDRLFYADDDAIMAVTFDATDGSIGVPQPLFSLGPQWIVHAFDVAPRDERFLVVAEDLRHTRFAIAVALGRNDRSDRSR